MAENNNAFATLKARLFDENTALGKSLLSIKNYFADMPKKKRNTIFGVAGGIVVLAAVLAIVLNITARKKQNFLYNNLHFIYIIKRK